MDHVIINILITTSQPFASLCCQDYQNSDYQICGSWCFRKSEVFTSICVGVCFTLPTILWGALCPS